jgi:hypothetical protein
LEVYLSALYPHPTEGLVGLFAERALGVSRILGREPEVLKALEYASNIPLEFEGKGRILAAMEGARWVAQTARLESKRAL